MFLVGNDQVTLKERNGELMASSIAGSTGLTEGFGKRTHKSPWAGDLASGLIYNLEKSAAIQRLQDTE